MQEDLRIEVLGPFAPSPSKNADAEIAIARIPPRALDCFDDCSSSEERDAIPEQISGRRSQKQSALTNGKIRLGSDAHEVAVLHPSSGFDAGCAIRLSVVHAWPS